MTFPWPLPSGQGTPSNGSYFTGMPTQFAPTQNPYQQPVIPPTSKGPDKKRQAQKTRPNSSSPSPLPSALNQPNTAGSSGTPSSLQQLMFYINQYGTLSSVPAPLLNKLGFKDATQAQNALVQYSQANKPQVGPVGSALNTAAKAVGSIFTPWFGGKPGSPGYNAAQGIAGTNAGTVGQILAIGGHPAPDIKPYIMAPPANPPATSATPAPATPVTPPAAETGPLAGGVNYGMPGGSTLGVPHGTFGGGTGVTDPSSAYPSAIDWSQIGSGAPDWNDYLKNLKLPNYVPIPVAPKPTPLQMNDFTGQASGMAATAYSPAFAAIEEAKANAKTNTANAQAITTGIYQDLGKDIGANADALDAKYAAAKAAGQADVTAAQQSIQAPNSAAAAGLQQAAAAAGQGKYVIDAVNRGNAQTNATVGDMAQLGLNETQAEGEHQLAFDTANTGLQNAAATQGSYSRQQLAFNLADTLSGFDQNKLNLTSEEALKVLDLAQSLSGQDMTMQQGNNDLQQQYYQNQFGAAGAQNQIIGSQRGEQIGLATTGYNNAFGAWDSDQNRRLQALGIETQNNQFNASQSQAILLEAMQEKSAMDIANARAVQSGTSAAPKLPDSGAYGMFVNEVANQIGPDPTTGIIDPQKVMDLTEFVMQIAYQHMAKHEATSYPDLVAEAQGLAGGKYTPTEIAAAVNAAYGTGMVATFPGSATLGQGSGTAPQTSAG